MLCYSKIRQAALSRKQETRLHNVFLVPCRRNGSSHSLLLNDTSAAVRLRFRYGIALIINVATAAKAQGSIAKIVAGYANATGYYRVRPAHKKFWVFEVCPTSCQDTIPLPHEASH